MPKNSSPRKLTAKNTKIHKPSSKRVLAPAKRNILKPKTWRRPRAFSYPPLPKARHIFKKSVEMIWNARKATIKITILYGILVIILVRGLATNQDLSTFKNLLDGLLTGTGGKIQSLSLQLTYLFSGTNDTSNTPGGSIYQTILLIIFSLALIRIYRQTIAKKSVTVKQAFYQGMGSLIPFLIVLLIVGIQLLPLTIGSYLYSTLTTTGIAVYGWEKALTLFVFIILALWSLRMIGSSIFALYIVSLPNMQPLQSLRSAKRLVTGRRLLIWRKILLLPFIIVLGTSLLLLPFLLFFVSGAVWMFFLLTTLWFTLIHAYLYTLYRELLRET